jgi:hypothetical protein
LAIGYLPRGAAHLRLEKLIGLLAEIFEGGGHWSIPVNYSLTIAVTLSRPVERGSDRCHKTVLSTQYIDLQGENIKNYPAIGG